jgi:hypothetical protein
MTDWAASTGDDIVHRFAMIHNYGPGTHAMGHPFRL